VFIPKDLHEQFECVVGKHVFIDKPWTEISRAKIINHLQDSNSCFWQFRRKLEVKTVYIFIIIVIIFFINLYNMNFIFLTGNKKRVRFSWL